MHCRKISLEFEFGVKGQRSRSPGTKNNKVQHFFGAVLAGAVFRGVLRAVCVWENIFNIAGVAGVAVGHATTSVSK